MNSIHSPLTQPHLDHYLTVYSPPQKKEFATAYLVLLFLKKKCTAIDTITRYIIESRTSILKKNSQLIGSQKNGWWALVTNERFLYIISKYFCWRNIIELVRFLRGATVMNGINNLLIQQNVSCSWHPKALYESICFSLTNTYNRCLKYWTIVPLLVLYLGLYLFHT